jgi:Mannosyltransferase
MYNGCHCEFFRLYALLSRYLLIDFWTVWSNFEIADMDFWRSPAYTAFFEHLDSTGGFYYEVRFSSHRLTRKLVT